MAFYELRPPSIQAYRYHSALGTDFNSVESTTLNFTGLRRLMSSMEPIIDPYVYALTSEAKISVNVNDHCLFIIQDGEYLVLEGNTLKVMRAKDFIRTYRHCPSEG